VTTPSHSGIAPRNVRDLRGAPDDDPERRGGAPPGLAPTLVVRPRSRWSRRPHGRSAARGSGALDDRASCACSDGTLGLPRSARTPGRQRDVEAVPPALQRSAELGVGLVPPSSETVVRLRSRQRTTVLSVTRGTPPLRQILDLDHGFAGPASATAGQALSRARRLLPAATMSAHPRDPSWLRVRCHGDPGLRVYRRGPRYGARRKLSRGRSDSSATFRGSLPGELPTAMVATRSPTATRPSHGLTLASEH
jgi:hypothetical protein